MASREAQAIAEKFVGQLPQSYQLKLARAIDELRIADLEKLREKVVTAFDRMECSKAIAALRAAQRKETE